MTTEHIEDIYELSPMQRGMLFHTLYAPHSGVYMEQALFSIQGTFDVHHGYESWRRVVAQHPPLRTAFMWEELDEPIQVVYPAVEIPWEHYDWREMPEDVRHASLEELLTKDRMRGFDLAQPPLLRITLIRVASDTTLLLFTHHHLLLDGWSLNSIMQEVFHVYEMLGAGQEPRLLARRPYSDYIHWLASRNLAEAERFWRNYLQGFTAPTTLMLDTSAQQADRHTPSSAQDDDTEQAREFRLRGGRPVELQGFTLSVAETAALRASARQQQVTLNTVVQGAWGLLLSRYSGEEDVVFGATVAGRPVELAGAEAMVGLFINTLPVRVQVSKRARLSQWLGQLQAQQAEARQFDYSPLVQVHGWSEVSREQPLFESLLVFENYHIERQEADHESSSTVRIHLVQSLEQTNYPLVVIIGPGAELEVQLGYEIGRFTPGAIRHMLDHLRILLQGFVAHPTARLLELSLLSDSERYQLVSLWKQAEATTIPDTGVPHLFQQQVGRTPDAIALVCQDQQLTYLALERLTNQLAQYLRRLGVGPEVRVGLCMERSPELMVGVLAILKAGGAYVPLDPVYPEERLAFVLMDAQVPLLLTQQRLVARFPATQTRIVCIDGEWATMRQEAVEPVCVRTQLDNAAYVIYTSGSTGVPKGVVITHRSLLNHCTAIGRRYELVSHDRVLQFASISFDVAIEELLPSWLHGAVVVLWPDPVAPSPGDFTRFVAQEQLTVLNIPSSYWHAWVAELVRPQAQHSAVDARLVIVGSEKVSAAQLRAWRDRIGDQVTWCNAYGLTETTVTTLLYQLENLKTGIRSVPIGRPIANTQAYVLDARMQPVPAGLPGELYISGLGLARGYLHRPELTAKRFLPHPFSDVAGARLYRTGDLVRSLPDGNLEFLGRTDTQVKVRGFRIELGEIEALLSRHVSVREAIVLVREDSPQEGQLVAYLATSHPSSSLLAQVRKHLQDTLPPYMIPAAFVFMETLPRLPSGKINQRALPATEPGSVSVDEAYEAPRTPLEEILAGIWSSVMRLERVGRNDHFFKIGGHSLQATQVVARLREVLRVELPVRAVYDAPTISALALAIERVRQSAKNQPVPPIQRADRAHALPLSFAQQRLWFLDQLQPGSAFYNIPGAFAIKGPLVVRAVEQSINALVRRHEPLRTTFALHHEQPVQRIAPRLHLSLPVIDMSAIADLQVRKVEALRLAREEARRPFDLHAGPLVRVALVYMDAHEHTLLLTLHHIVADGWSADLFFRELKLYYNAYTTGQSVELPELTIQYADYAVWQREWLQGTILEAQLAYWRAQLVGMPPLLALPTDHPRPAVQTFHGTQHYFTLAPTLAARLKDLSQREGVTLFMTLLATFQIVLARYSGQTDIAIGTPIAGRTRSEVEHLIGFFVNTLVLRTDLAGNPSFKDVLARVREVTLGAYMHQELPFEKLVEELHPERNLSQSPLFQVLFMFQNVSPDRSRSSGLRLESLDIGSETAKFDLSLEMADTPVGIECVIEYNTDLFHAATIERLPGHYSTMLESVLADPEQPVMTLPLLTPGERRQLLGAWNATQRSSPAALCLHTLFEVQAEQTPDRVAVVYEEQQVTYSALNRRANQLAHYLQHLGIDVESAVGVCIERSLDMVVAILGILKAGGVYVPLDPGYPAQRLTFLLEDTRLAVLLTQQKLLERLPEHRSRVVCLDTMWEEIAQQPACQLKTRVTPDNLAYIIYTSGSTGTPKGVAMAHAPLVNLFDWQQRHTALLSGVRTLQFASLSFDVASQEIFCTLGFGHTLVLLSDTLRRDPLALLRLASAEMVERLFLPVVALQQLAEAAAEAGDVPYSLREVITAGEQLQITPQVVTLFEQLPACQLSNQYGPSESHVVSGYRLPGAPRDWPFLPAIGRPIDNTELYVLDAYAQPVPVGVPGELHIGGRGLARGYLHRPDRTAERFVPHPFSPLPGARLYKTGDLVCYLPDGNLQFLGRRDQQVKLRGFRIELGEIETVLGRYPGVDQVVVIVREDAPGDKTLVAYLVMAGNAPTPEMTELRLYLHMQLPEYMVPARFVLLDELPLTTSAKVDRRALPAPTATELTAGDASVSARTPLEEVLLAIWSDILRREHIGVHDNFFDLGGHSLLSTQMMARIRQTLRADVPLRAIFEAPTVAELAAWIEAAGGFGATVVPPLVPRSSTTDPLLLSYAQERLWFLHQLEPASPAYNISVVLRMQGDLNTDALSESLHVLMQRHEVLRTTFAVIDGVPRQVIASPSLSEPLLLDISKYSPQEREQEAQRRATEFVLQAFDLSRGPLLRTALLRLREDEHILLITLHHSITDGWSMGILLTELSEVYSAIVTERACTLPVLPIQYADYALWQRNWLQGEVLEQQLAYWRKQLHNAPTVLNLPADHTRPVVQSYRGDVASFSLSPDLHHALRVLSRQETATLFMTLLAAFQTLLLRYSGQTDQVTGTPIAGRTQRETEGLLGLFINMLALRTDLSGDPSFRVLLGRVREVCLQAYAHQEVPFEKIVEAIQPQRSLSHHPLFQIMFILQNTPAGKPGLPGLQLQPMALSTTTTKFDLTMEFVETTEGLQGIVEYNSDLFERDTIQRLIKHYQRLLAAIVANPDQRLSSLTLLDEDELRHMLLEWNATATDLSGFCVQQSFEQQVARTPDATAAIYEGRRLSYAELNQRANQLAHHLQRLGVGPDVLVGLFMERSLELVVAVMGILKAGGAYVPLDPTYPAERLGFLLHDARLDIVVTQQRLLARISAQGRHVVCIDGEQEMLAREKTTNPACRANLDTLAYVIYTSGSTGQPKGVMVAHRGLTNYLAWSLKAYRVAEGKGSLFHSSLASDLSVTSLFTPLLTGQCLMVLPEGQGIDSLTDALRVLENLSLVKLTPAHLVLLSEQLPARDVSGRTHALIIGGEALLQEHLTFWQTHAPETRLINEYGPTETVVGCCVYEATTPDADRKSIPIGRPIANTQLYVLDQHLRPVPVDVYGELYIAGSGVARGYLQLPALTAERFLPNPFSKEPGGRFYRTGDIARYRADGTLEYLGRNDSQVKLRGYRIELGEIEAVLSGHSGVQKAVVLLEQGHTLAQKRLVAYLVGRPAYVLSEGELRNYLRERLPDYMVPALYVMLDVLPLTSNGKVDRQALQALTQTRQEAKEAGEEPRNAVEEELVKIWAWALGRERVGIYDNFFDLGGHSLLVAQVISRVRESLQVEMPLRVLFEKPTVVDFAEAVIQKGLEQVDDSEMLAMLAEFEELSAGEV